MKFSSTEVTLYGFKINELGRGCKVAFGHNRQVRMTNATKKNSGFGRQNANHSVTYFPVSKIEDGDLNDGSPIKKS